MVKLSRLVGVLSCAAVVAIAGCSANSSSSLTPSTGSIPQAQPALAHGLGWTNENGVLFSTPHYFRTLGSQRQGVHPDYNLTYRGGPVLTKPKMYLIIWGYKGAGDPNHVQALLKSYAKAIGGSKYNNIYTQYYGPGSVHILNPTAQFGGIWLDNTNPIPSSPTDGQVAAEAVAGVAHFGYNANGSYVVATAHNHNSSGFGSSYCAYHGATTSSGKLVSYTNLPYMPDAGPNCGANFISPPSDEAGADEGVTIVEGHEYGESVTDPNPPTGWYDNSGGEIGDICAWQNIQNDPYKLKTYTAQPMFSDASSSCVHSYP
jgi:hypothetical protein